jgi:hypothetical protein
MRGPKLEPLTLSDAEKTKLKRLAWRHRTLQQLALHRCMILAEAEEKNIRKLLKQGSFTSAEDLQTRIFAFIDYYNRTMAKDFKWMYQGKPLPI